MEKYLKEIISQKGLSEAYKECIHMIESPTVKSLVISKASSE